MIEGLKLDFTTAQVKEHAQARQQHHNEREKFYSDQAALLKKDADNMNVAGEKSTQNYSGGSPVEQLENNARLHKQKAQIFGVIKDHLMPNEIYRLETDDLERYEFIYSRRY